jgi:hypothetical protein
MRSPELQASSALTIRAWHRINWAACHRQVRSRQRRIVQAVQAGAWRQVKRLSYLLGHAFAARAVAVKRVTENTRQTPPEWMGTSGIPQRRKPTSSSASGDGNAIDQCPCNGYLSPRKMANVGPCRSRRWSTERGRRCLQALPPIAATKAAPTSYGCRPKRRCTDAIDQGFNVLRQHSSATWLLEGDIQNFFDKEQRSLPYGRKGDNFRQTSWHPCHCSHNHCGYIDLRDVGQPATESCSSDRYRPTFTRCCGSFGTSYLFQLRQGVGTA